MEQNSTYDKGFSLSMALVDLIPVALFCIAGILAFGRLQSMLLGAGVLFSTLAGLFKAEWKLLLAIQKRDIPQLPKLFHILMPLGFLLMLASVPVSFSVWRVLFQSLLKLPALVFVILGAVGMVMMMVFAVKLDGKKVSSNWIEQLTNTAAQACFVIALLLA